MQQKCKTAGDEISPFQKTEADTGYHTSKWCDLDGPTPDVPDFECLLSDRDLADPPARLPDLSDPPDLRPDPPDWCPDPHPNRIALDSFVSNHVPPSPLSQDSGAHTIIDWDDAVLCMGVRKRCMYEYCANKRCQMGSEYINILEAGLWTAGAGPETWTTITNGLLYGIVKHAQECPDSELTCSVPLCSLLHAQFPGNLLNMADKIATFCRIYGRQPIVTDPHSPSEVTHFPGCRFGNEELVQYRATKFIDKLGDLAMAVGQISCGPGISFMVKQEAGSNLDIMLHVLADGATGNTEAAAITPDDAPIIEHHWHVQQGPMCYIAKANYHKLLSPELFRELGMTRVSSQLVEIAVFLHKKRVLLLDWSPKNFCVDGSGKIKLYELAGCKMLDDVMGDETEVQVAALSLPPVLVAPEMWAGFVKFPSTDMWGLGVLLYYLHTGHYPIDVHQPLDEQRTQLRQSTAVDSSSVCGEMRRWLDLLLCEDPCNRPTLAEVQWMLTTSEVQ